MPAQDSDKVGDMVPKNSRQNLFTALDFFGDLPSTMPAQDSNKVGDMVPKNSRQNLFTALDFFGDLPSTMPAQDSDKVGDMVPKNFRQQALNLVLQYVLFLQLLHVLLVASLRGSVDNENLTAA